MILAVISNDPNHKNNMFLQKKMGEKWLSKM